MDERRFSDGIKALFAALASFASAIGAWIGLPAGVTAEIILAASDAAP